MIERLKGEERKARRAGWMDNIAAVVFRIDSKPKEEVSIKFSLNFYN